MHKIQGNFKRFRNLVFGLILFAYTCGPAGKPARDAGSFSLAFLTDIHLQPELNAPDAFDKLIKSVNKINPDLVITGGDLVMDSLNVPYERANLLFDLYRDKIRGFKAKVYNTIGNHDIFGWDKESGVEPGHQFFGKKLYRARIGKSYYSFDYQKWHFISLDSIQKTDEGGYIGQIDREQVEWIRKDLLKIDKNRPIAICTHIPFITVKVQLLEGTMEPVTASTLITNGKEVLDLFKDHNLKLVLQGHLHFYEEIRSRGITFITGGAVSGNWWKGPLHGIQEGFVLIKIQDGKINSRYIDYGWETEG